MVCPKCGSVDVVHDYSQPALVAGGIFSYKCNNCEHVAVSFPEVQVRDLQKPKEPQKIQDKVFVEEEFGKGMMGFFKIIAPLGVLFNILLMVESDYFWFGLFGVFFFLAITLLSFDKEIHKDPLKLSILWIFIISGILLGSIIFFWR